MSKRNPEALTPIAGHELRLAELTGVSIRAAATEGDPIGFTGVAAVMNVPTVIGGKYGWVEQLDSTAFDETLRNDDIRMLKNHNTDLPLARTTAGSLRLEAVKDELRTDADMDPVSYAKDLAISLDRGTLSGMSIGFQVKSDTWSELPEDHPLWGKTAWNELRTIHVVKLWEVSPVTFPAFVDTSAGLRAHECELALRALGYVDEDQIRDLVRQVRAGRVPTTPATASTSAATQESPATPAGRQRRNDAAQVLPGIFAGS